tara:strand:- start:404 stop:514 length:111 start_codon:yes stop_codon:yes gene_type:complete
MRGENKMVSISSGAAQAGVRLSVAPVIGSKLSHTHG